MNLDGDDNYDDDDGDDGNNYDGDDFDVSILFSGQQLIYINLNNKKSWPNLTPYARLVQKRSRRPHHGDGHSTPTRTMTTQERTPNFAKVRTLIYVLTPIELKWLMRMLMMMMMRTMAMKMTTTMTTKYCFVGIGQGQLAHYMHVFPKIVHQLYEPI